MTRLKLVLAAFAGFFVGYVAGAFAQWYAEVTRTGRR